MILIESSCVLEETVFLEMIAETPNTHTHKKLASLRRIMWGKKNAHTHTKYSVLRIECAEVVKLKKNKKTHEVLSIAYRMC